MIYPYLRVIARVLPALFAVLRGRKFVYPLKNLREIEGVEVTYFRRNFLYGHVGIFEQNGSLRNAFLR